MAELDDLDTGEVDLWDHKLAAEVTNVLKIFAEVVDENVLIPGEGSVVSGGQTVANFPNGIPCTVRFRLPASATEFEFIVNGQRIQQNLVARDVASKPTAVVADDFLLDFGL
jgi:hypothetical protein